MTGLAIVLVLIGLASAIFSSANRDQAVTAVGAANASVVANMTVDGAGTVAEHGQDEPLAELGVAPSASDTPAPAAQDPRRRR
jgi:hypothetical protein